MYSKMMRLLLLSDFEILIEKSCEIEKHSV